MKKSESDRVMLRLRNMLQSHVGIPLTPELATGMLTTMRVEVESMIEPEKKKRAPRKKQEPVPQEPEKD